MKSWITRVLLVAIVTVLATGTIAMAQETHPLHIPPSHGPRRTSSFPT